MNDIKKLVARIEKLEAETAILRKAVGVSMWNAGGLAKVDLIRDQLDELDAATSGESAKLESGHD